MGRDDRALAKFSLELSRGAQHSWKTAETEGIGATTLPDPGLAGAPWRSKQIRWSFFKARCRLGCSQQKAGGRKHEARKRRQSIGKRGDFKTCIKNKSGPREVFAQVRRSCTPARKKRRQKQGCSTANRVKKAQGDRNKQKPCRPIYQAHKTRSERRRNPLESLER